MRHGKWSVTSQYDTGNMCSNAFRGQVEGLEIERNRLQHTIAHLQKTNRELEEYIQTEGHDKDMRDAIGENIVTIAKFRGQLDRLDQEIRKARGEVVDVTSSQRAAVPVKDDPKASANASPQLPYATDTENTGHIKRSTSDDGSLWL